MKIPVLLLISCLVASCTSVATLTARWHSHECDFERGDPRVDRSRIAKVTSISILGSTLTAKGETTTAGYQQASLRQLPGAGLTDTRTYEFVANPPPPGSMTLQVISPHTATIRLDDPGIRHVRVLGARNVMCADRE